MMLMSWEMFAVTQLYFVDSALTGREAHLKMNLSCRLSLKRVIHTKACNNAAAAAELFMQFCKLTFKALN